MLDPLQGSESMWTRPAGHLGELRSIGRGSALEPRMGVVGYGDGAMGVRVLLDGGSYLRWRKLRPCSQARKEE